MGKQVEIFEVGPRDGLQNEPVEIATAAKAALIDCLSQAGFRRIEVGSFVSPKWVPQMANSADVFNGITRKSGLRYAALTPNMQGYEAARLAKADEIAIFVSASEGFSKANINASIAQSLARLAPVAQKALQDKIPVRGYVSCVSDCPFDGPVEPENVAAVSEALLQMGCYEISLGDTIGRATPARIDAMLRAVCAVVPPEKLAGHFHDTSGGAIANINVALKHGLRVFDAAVGGLGGCPYAPGAAGNVATESVEAHLRALGFETGLDPAVVQDAAAMARAMRQA